MKLYVIIKTARKDVKEFPDCFGLHPRKPTLSLADSSTGDICTLNKQKVERTASLLTAEYGQYFNYTVHELEIKEE